MGSGSQTRRAWNHRASPSNTEMLSLQLFLHLLAKDVMHNEAPAEKKIGLDWRLTKWFSVENYGVSLAYDLNSRPFSLLHWVLKSRNLGKRHRIIWAILLRCMVSSQHGTSERNEPQLRNCLLGCGASDIEQNCQWYILSSGRKSTRNVTNQTGRLCQCPLNQEMEELG